jgi:hypothetical protein
MFDMKGISQEKVKVGHNFSSDEYQRCQQKRHHRSPHNMTHHMI